MNIHNNNNNNNNDDDDNHGMVVSSVLWPGGRKINVIMKSYSVEPIAWLPLF